MEIADESSQAELVPEAFILCPNVGTIKMDGLLEHWIFAKNK